AARAAGEGGGPDRRGGLPRIVEPDAARADRSAGARRGDLRLADAAGARDAGRCRGEPDRRDDRDPAGDDAVDPPGPARARGPDRDLAVWGIPLDLRRYRPSSASRATRLARQSQLSQPKPSDTRFLFVTGGVVSSLGKGIASASLGRLLVSRGFRVQLQKLDPYI